MTFYERLKELANERGETPTGVGRIVGADGSTVNYWEKGHVPKNKTLDKIAKHFDVSIDYLIGNTSDRTSKNLIKSGDDIAKVALFGGSTEVTEEMWNEVKDYVEYIKQKHLKD